MSTEGTYLIEIERHYIATIEVEADSKREAIRYAHSDENQHIANHNEDYFYHFEDLLHKPTVAKFKSYEEQYPEED